MYINNYNNRNFIIKKNSTLPKLKYPLTQRLMEKYDITNEMMEDVAITFSMIDEDTGLYRLANVEAEVIVSNDRPEEPDEKLYTLAYQFSVKETSRAGIFLGEFVIDFLSKNNCGKIKFPVDDNLIINIQDSITKTDVV